jgi:hypothetical protein
MTLFGIKTSILVFLALVFLCLPPLPVLLKRSMPHNNEEVFQISSVASQPLLFV